MNQSVWNNKHINNSGGPLYDTTLSDKGINYVKEQLMSIDTVSTKEFYDLLISKIFKLPSSQKTIARKLNVEMSNWKETHSLPRKITHDSH